jgi:hypothetical protein
VKSENSKVRSERDITNALLTGSNVFGIVIMTFAFCLLPFHSYGINDKNQLTECFGEDSLVIESTCRNGYVIRMGEINELSQKPDREQQNYRQQGYVNQTGIEILPGRSSTSVRFQMVHGYQFHPLFSAGIGTGFSTYNDPLSLIPFYLDLRLKLFEANTTSFIFLKTGYNISVHHDERVTVDNHSGGMMINPGIGIQFDTPAGFGFYFHAGYNIDEASFEQNIGGGQTIVTDLSYKRIHFGMGLSF